jgi:hypothetical protein
MADKLIIPLINIPLFKTRSKIFQFLKDIIPSLIKSFEPLSASYDAKYRRSFPLALPLGVNIARK